jgi:hypothetical protein
LLRPFWIASFYRLGVIQYDAGINAVKSEFNYRINVINLLLFNISQFCRELCRIKLSI